jgi:hypothetical protein
MDALAVLPRFPSCLVVGTSSLLDSPDPMTDSALDGIAVAPASVARSAISISRFAAGAAVTGEGTPTAAGLFGRRKDELAQDSRDTRGVTMGIGRERLGLPDGEEPEVLEDLDSRAERRSGLLSEARVDSGSPGRGANSAREKGDVGGATLAEAGERSVAEALSETVGLKSALAAAMFCVAGPSTVRAPEDSSPLRGGVLFGASKCADAGCREVLTEVNDSVGPEDSVGRDAGCCEDIREGELLSEWGGGGG